MGPAQALAWFVGDTSSCPAAGDAFRQECEMAVSRPVDCVWVANHSLVELQIVEW